MQLTNTPGKLVLPFANSGAKNTIPTASQIGITAGAASLVDGFPPLTRTPIAAGGVPPSGLDMNGILYELSAILRWANAGGGYAYDAAFATDSNVGGYPKGARVMRSDGLGYWFNTVENNTTDPEAAGAAAAGWVPDFTNGVTSVAMASANVTLTPLQYGKPIIVITGTLTANLNLIFPTIVNEWTVINNTTGPYTITCKTAAGTGVVVAGAIRLVGDGANIYATNTLAQTAPQFDNSLIVATTQFVQRALGSFSGVSVLSGATALTAGDVGKNIILSGSSAFATTLPATAGLPNGAAISIENNASVDCTVVRAGADTIAPNASSAISSISIPAGTQITFVKVNVVWYAFGSGAASYQSSFANYIAGPGSTGYQKLPGGLIIQWGGGITTPANNVAVNVTLPIAWPNALLSGVANPTGLASNAGVFGLQATGGNSKTQISITQSGTSPQGTFFIAIGY